MAFLPFLGITAAAIGLLQLGALAVTVLYLKVLLAFTFLVALLLGLGHVWRWHRDSQR